MQINILKNITRTGNHRILNQKQRIESNKTVNQADFHTNRFPRLCSYQARSAPDRGIHISNSNNSLQLTEEIHVRVKPAASGPVYRAGNNCLYGDRIHHLYGRFHSGWM